MKLETYSLCYINNPQNCLYPNRLIVKNETIAKKAFSHNYVCTKYKDVYKGCVKYIIQSVTIYY